MKIAILGFGTVGQGVYRILEEEKKRYQSRFDRDIEVIKILVRDVNKTRKTSCPQALFTDNFEEIISDPEIELLIEVTSDKAQAIQYIKSGLKHGKHVISANKAAIASEFKELQKIAAKKSLHLKFEASVGGGIPLLSPLGRMVAFNNISIVRGIINSSTNYILTEICKGRELNKVMAEAKEIGVLEEDPTDDVAGYDARRKLAILSMMVLDTELDEKEIPCFGITQIDSKDTRILQSEGYDVKLIAELLQGEEAGLEANQYSTSVMPTALKKSYFNRVNGLYNEVALVGSRSGELRFFGAGGSMNPTANAVVSDLYEVLTNQPIYFPIKNKDLKNVSSQIKSRYYIRVPENLANAQELRDSLTKITERVLQNSSDLALITNEISIKEALDLFTAGVHIIRINQEVK